MSGFVWKTVLGCGAAILLGMSVSAVQAGSNKAHQWEMDIHRTTPDGKVKDATTYICMGAKTFANPPKRLTGPRCSDQVFTVTEDGVSWTASCDAAKGQGQWNFSHGGNRLEGQSTIDTPDGRTVTEIKAEVFGDCTL